MIEKKKITKRVISKLASTRSSAGENVEVEKVVEKLEEAIPTKRSCYFCQSKQNPSYTDLVNLKKYLTERAKIVAKLRSSLCSKHQRAVGKQIKYARHLSLLPFVPKV